MKINKCMQCKSDKLFPFLSLGFHPHSDQFRQDPDEPEMTYPLGLQLCENCSLIQLTYMVDRAELFTKDYLYESSITQTALKHWEEMSQTILSKVGLKQGLVVDIGGNDGTLLERFKDKGLQVLNIDPCPDITDIAKEKGIPTITSFWKKGLIKNADLILGTNVFAHIDDYYSFIEAVDDSLKPNGVFVFESPYVMEFINGLEYSTVYHQHVTYLGLKSTINFLDKVNMEIFDIDFTPLHGGSFRCYVARKGQREIKSIVNESIAKENLTKEVLLEFGRKTKEHSDKLFDIVYNLYKEGKKICCVSAPAKGMTQMNYTQLNRLVSFVTEKSKLKVGRYTPGGRILIVDDSKLLDTDVAILLAWNFSKEIMENNKDFKGTWIIPNDKIEVIYAKK